MSAMTFFDGPVFDMARRQFDAVADHLDMPGGDRDRVFYPKRALAVSCPVHRDDGSTEVFQGYRVQHHLTLGPTKGGTRFAPMWKQATWARIASARVSGISARGPK